MQQWPTHSLYGYFTRLPTYKLELILDTQDKAAENSLLQPKDYEFIRQILQTRPDSKLLIHNQSH